VATGKDMRHTPKGVRRRESSSVRRTRTAAVTAAVRDTAGQEGAMLPGTLGRPDASVDQMQDVFHELHAEGRHALCEVCTDQHRY
jgi:hypothetical protein